MKKKNKLHDAVVKGLLLAADHELKNTHDIAMLVDIHVKLHLANRINEVGWKVDRMDLFKELIE